MFFLLLESIFIYGNLDNSTNILVYTSTPFMNKIKQSHLFNNEKINFEINDTYNDIDKACKARLDFFNLPSIILSFYHSIILSFYHSIILSILSFYHSLHLQMIFQFVPNYNFS